MITTLIASTVLTFAGSCELQELGSPFQSIGNFSVGGDETSCDNTSLSFSAVKDGVRRDFGIYVEFQRSEFGPGLAEKLYIGYSDSADQTVNNHVRTFNATPGTVLDFEQKVGDTTRLFCSGTVVE